MGREPAWWRFGAWASLLLGVAIVGRAWLFAPVLPFEDGTLLFARSYAEPRLSDWVCEYAGYVPVGSNVSAWLCCRLPTPWIPFAFTLCAMTLHAMAAASVLHPAWRPLGPFWLRFAIAGVAAWLPLGSGLQPVTLSYVQWSMLWWLLVVLLRPCDASAGARWRQGLLVAGLVLWHPLAGALAPLLLWRSVRVGRGEVVGCYVASVCVYWVLRQLVVTEAPGVDVGRLASVPWTWLVRVVLEAFAGYELRPWLVGHAGATGAAVVGGFVLCGAAWLVSRAVRGWAPSVRAFVVGAVWIGLVAVTAAALRRDELDPDAYWPVRYYGIGRLGMLVVVLAALGRVASRRWLLGALLALVGSVALGGSGRYLVHEGGYPAMRRFMDELQRQEGERGGRRWIRARLRKDSGWGILIRPR